MVDLFDSRWYWTQYDAISQLVLDPEYAPPAPDEPILEVIIDRAELDPKHVSEVYSPFVKLYMDDEMVGESSASEGYHVDMHRPVWNERILVVPRDCYRAHFELCSRFGNCLDSVKRGQCALNLASLWRCAAVRPIPMDLPLMRGATQVGVLKLRFQKWDGQPLIK